MGLVQYYPSSTRPLTPVISVCVANYNGTSFLADCLNSIFSQDVEGEIEVIVHDDASTDDSVTWLLDHYPQVELLASRKNVGFCASNNRMTDHAKGEYLLLLNNDAALLPGALNSLLKIARAQTTPGIATLPQYDWQSGLLVDRGCLLDPFYNPIPNTDPERQDVAMVIGACLFIKRELWTSLGGFPEWLESIGEDLYLCCQARLRSFPVQVTNDSGYRHRQGASFGGNRADSRRGLSTTFNRRRLSERNKTFTMVVCTPGALLWALLALHLVLLNIEGLLLSLMRRDAALWRTVYAPVTGELWKNRVRLKDARRSTQSQKHTSVRQYFHPFAMRLRKLDLLLRHGAPRFRP